MTWHATTLSTNPAFLEVATTELLTLAYDPTLDLAPGETVTAGATRLLRLDTLEAVTIDPPALVGNTLTQLIDGGDLTRDLAYELTWSCTITPTKVLSRTTVLQVVA